MDFSFLYDKFWGISIQNWTLFFAFIIIGLLLKRSISLLFTKILFNLIRKKFGDYSGSKFKDLLTKPISGLIANIFYFLAITRLLPKIDELIIIPSLKKSFTKANVVERTNPITLFDLLQHLLYFAILYYGFLLVVRMVEYIFNLKYKKAVSAGDKEPQQVLPLLRDILKVMVWILGFMTIMGIVFHINVAALVAGLGIGGIAIAFAAKESLENLIASFMVLFDRSFAIGDWVKVGDVEGIIERVGVRSSRLRTFDKTLIIIPNRKLMDSNVENYSKRGVRRVKTVIGGIYGISRENFEKAIEQIKTNIATINGVNHEQGINMWLNEFGGSQLDLILVYFVDVNEQVDFFKVKHEVNFIIYQTMYQFCEGFAFPTQTSIHSDGTNQVFPPLDNNQ